MALSRQEGFGLYILNGVQVTDRELGRGSYAAVVELEYKGLKCAGKKIFRILYEQGIGHAAQHYLEECRLLSQMRHPNVVQFLGVHFERGVCIPILVMEFLPTNLSSCIDQYGAVLPKEINYSILHDVSLGLNYLHSQTPPVIHRDLSANNVLLASNMTAKISDLGVAKILNLTPLQMSRMTETPGTPTYMPPEVMVADPKYDTSVDMFSYGIMMIHVFSGKWPHPTVGQVHVGSNRQLVPISEAKRREEYLHDIGQDHPLMDLILRCINNDSRRRGSASEIVQRLKDAVIQFPPSFANKVEMLSRIEALEREKRVLVVERERKDGEIERKDKQVKQMGDEIVDLKKKHQRTVERLELVHSTEVEQLRSEVRDKSAQVEVITSEKQATETEKKKFTEEVSKIIESQEEASKRAVEAYKEAHKKTIERIQTKQANDIKKLQSELNAIRSEYSCKKQEMEAAISAKEQEIALKNRTIETKDLEIVSKDQEIARKDLDIEKKRQILDGITASLISNIAYITHKDNRIKVLSDQLTRTRDYLSSKPQQIQSMITWKQCKDIPFNTISGQTTVINSIIYYGGSNMYKDEDHYYYCIVYCYDPSQNTWSSLPPLPVEWFGLGQVRGQLVAVGGTRISDWKASNEVYVFDERSKKWKGSLPSMPTARRSSAVISHPSSLIVAGGLAAGSCVNAVEIFNTETSKWYKTDSLLIPCCNMSTVVVGDTCYLVGGYETSSRLNRVFCTSVEQLLHNATPFNQASPNESDTLDHVSVWRKLADTPNYHPTAAVIADTVLSIGGASHDKPEKEKDESSVYMYSPTTDSWIYITDLPSPRCRAATAMLSPTEIMVIGGWDGNNQKQTVYKGTLSLSI